MKDISPRSAYIAFDRFPSSKGSATHIEQMIKVLQECCGPTILFTLPGTISKDFDGIIPYIFDDRILNFLERAEAFSQWVFRELNNQSQVSIIHFRDIWGGMAAMRMPHMTAVFEVNGLPSIELPYRYPSLHPATLKKIEEIEDACFRHADQIIVPSRVIKSCLISKGVPANKIEVITNGAMPLEKLSEKPGLPEKYILFFGALQSWQGVGTLLKAFTYLSDLEDLHLVICSSQSEKQVKEYRKVIERLGLQKKVKWFYQLDKQELGTVISSAFCTAAPLTECSRNVVQGCSPLKIIESMSYAVPLVASRIDAVKEILIDGEDAYLVAPDRPAELARVIRQMWDDPEKSRIMGQNAYRSYQKNFTWQQKGKELEEVYLRIMNSPITMKLV